MSYEMMQLVHLTCREDRVQSPTRKEGWDLFQRTSEDNSRFTPINIHKDEPKALRVRDTVTERASEEYKRVIDPPLEMKIILGKRNNSRWRKVWWDFQTKVRGLRHTLSCVTQLGDIIYANPSSYGRSYDQRVKVDHGEWFLGYGSET